MKSAIEASTAYANSLNGYELSIAMEVRRGSYLHSYEQPAALPANQPLQWQIPLRDKEGWTTVRTLS